MKIVYRLWVTVVCVTTSKPDIEWWYANDRLKNHLIENVQVHTFRTSIEQQTSYKLWIMRRLGKSKRILNMEKYEPSSMVCMYMKRQRTNQPENRKYFSLNALSCWSWPRFGFLLSSHIWFSSFYFYFFLFSNRKCVMVCRCTMFFFSQMSALSDLSRNPNSTWLKYVHEEWVNAFNYWALNVPC